MLENRNSWQLVIKTSLFYVSLYVTRKRDVPKRETGSGRVPMCPGKPGKKFHHMDIYSTWKVRGKGEMSWKITLDGNKTQMEGIRLRVTGLNLEY